MRTVYISGLYKVNIDSTLKWMVTGASLFRSVKVAVKNWRKAEKGWMCCYADTCLYLQWQKHILLGTITRAYLLYMYAYYYICVRTGLITIQSAKA